MMNIYCWAHVSSCAAGENDESGSTMTTHSVLRRRRLVSHGLIATALLVSLGTVTAHGEPKAPFDQQSPSVQPLANLAHINLLGDTVAPPVQEGHSTYRQDQDPELGVLWTYADRRDGGVYEPVGGGPYDETTNTW